MIRKVELGVFMPVGSNGFLMSKRTPRYQPTFELHRQIAVAAEEAGLDYLFWMGKWKGFGGETHFWENTIEPVSMASAIAASTTRLKLFATINPLLFHPAVAAKMIATVDGISGGRFGINVVTGNTMDELEQMGLVPDGYSDYRYEYADEWLKVMKLLWTNERSNFEGRFFSLKDCVSGPKPLQKPYPTIVSAGTSDDGLRFAAEHSDYAFMGIRQPFMDKVRAFAAERGRTIKISGNVFLLPRATDAEAEAEFEAIREDLDHEALENLIGSFERDNRASYGTRTEHLRQPTTVGFGSGSPVVGSPATIARKLASMIVDGGADGLQFTFVDFVKDLKVFQNEIAPVLADLLGRAGVTAGISSRYGALAA